MDIIQRTISWLEMKLEEPVRNEEVVLLTGYSFFHFHRLFQEKVGMSLHEYVRQRRLTSAANILIYTDTRILDIAFKYQLEWPENLLQGLLGKLMDYHQVSIVGSCELYWKKKVNRR